MSGRRVRSMSMTQSRVNLCRGSNEMWLSVYRQGMRERSNGQEEVGEQLIGKAYVYYVCIMCIMCIMCILCVCI